MGSALPIILLSCWFWPTTNLKLRDTKVKGKTIAILEDDIEEWFYGLKLENNLLNKAQQPHTIKGKKNNKIVYIKFKSFNLSTETIKSMKISQN